MQANNTPEKSRANSVETVRNTSIFSFFTIISRFLGLARDALKAYAFGTSVFAVAFDIAFRLPNMMRNLVAEGALSQSFVPIYEMYKSKDVNSEREASGVVITLFAAGLTLLSIVAWLLLPLFLPRLIHNLQNQETVELTVSLSRLLFPYIIFMSLTSIYMAIQYSHGVFWAASIGPAGLNAFVLFFFGGYLAIAPRFDLPSDTRFLVYLFSAVTLGAGLAQTLFQKHVVQKMGFAPRYQWNRKHPAIQNLSAMMLPAAFGAAVQELGQLIDIFLATSVSHIVPGAVAALTYSHRLIHLPMGVFGIAISTASLPQFSKLHKENRREEFIDAIWNAIGLNLFLIVPATLGLIIFAEPIVALLFERGEFDSRSTQITSVALQYYAAGILGFSLQKLFLSSMYARRNSRTPALITIFVLAINIVLSVIFMQYLYHAGLALGSTLAGYVGAAIYLYLLLRDGFFQVNAKQLIDVIKIVAANILLFVLLIYLRKAVGGQANWQQVLIAIPAALAAYLGLSYLFRLTPFHLFLQILRKRR